MPVLVGLASLGLLALGVHHYRRRGSPNVDPRKRDAEAPPGGKKPGSRPRRGHGAGVAPEHVDTASSDPYEVPHASSGQASSSTSIDSTKVESRRTSDALAERAGANNVHDQVDSRISQETSNAPHPTESALEQARGEESSQASSYRASQFPPIVPSLSGSQSTRRRPGSVSTRAKSTFDPNAYLGVVRPPKRDTEAPPGGEKPGSIPRRGHGAGVAPEPVDTASSDPYEVPHASSGQASSSTSIDSTKVESRRTSAHAPAPTYGKIPRYKDTRYIPDALAERAGANNVHGQVDSRTSQETSKAPHPTESALEQARGEESSQASTYRSSQFSPNGRPLSLSEQLERHRATLRRPVYEGTPTSTSTPFDPAIYLNLVSPSGKPPSPAENDKKLGPGGYQMKGKMAERKEILERGQSD